MLLALTAVYARSVPYLDDSINEIEPAEYKEIQKPSDLLDDQDLEPSWRCFPKLNYTAAQFMPKDNISCE